MYMAKKRVIIVTKEEEEEAEPLHSKRSMQASIPWPEWTKLYFLRYWYFVVCALIDTFVPLEVYRLIDESYDYVAAFLLLAVFLLVQVFIYLRLWGKNGPWSPVEIEE
ncbi:MAG: hypothetical protein MIO87_00100 [Methanomassiliicoccales archaeon]|nr:hypothetical protein [Methanomassiliicoccales archaeon]